MNSRQLVSRSASSLLVVIMTSVAWGLTVPMKDIPTELDPQKNESIYQMVVNLQLHRGLMRFLPNLSITPDLAESYEVLDNGKRIRFQLAKRTFADGQRVTADHVVRTFQRLFQLRSGFAADMDYIVNARMILKASDPNRVIAKLGVHALGSETVEFSLAKPVSVFLTHLAAVDAAILPLKPDLVYNWRTMAGAGPYRLKDAKSGEIGLERAEAWLNGERQTPKSPRDIRFISLSTDEAVKAALEAKVDCLDGYSLSQPSLEQLKRKGWQETVSTVTRQLFLVQNPKRIEKKVRDAIFGAVVGSDDALLPPPYVKSYGLIPTGMAGALTSAAGQKVTTPALKKPEKIILTIVDSEPALVVLAQKLVSLLEPLKIEVQVKTIPLKDYLPTIERKDYDILVRGKFLDYPDGLSILTYFRSHYAANTFFIEDPAVDTLLDQALVALDKRRRIDFYEEIQRRILAHKVVVPVVFGSDNRGLWGPTVRLVPAHPLGLQGLSFETIEVR